LLPVNSEVVILFCYSNVTPLEVVVNFIGGIIDHHSSLISFHNLAVVFASS